MVRLATHIAGWIGGRVLDILLGPAEEFEYTSRTSPKPFDSSP